MRMPRPIASEGGFSHSLYPQWVAAPLTPKTGLQSNRKHIEVDIRLTRETGIYDKEKAPTTPELRRILDAADTRQKVGISLMAFSGFRDETLGDYTGVDGLKISDFPEMEIRDGMVDFKAIPTRVICRPPISKVGYEYASFLNNEGCDYLKAYLEERMRSRKKETKRDGLVETRENPRCLSVSRPRA